MPLTEEHIVWDMTLAAFCIGDPQRTIRFLTGAVITCGGWVLSRSITGSDSAEISFEFARAVSVEIYSLLIAAGLELGRDAHIQMTELCQCTKDLIATCAYEVARIRLRVIEKPVPSGRNKGDDKPGAPGSPEWGKG
ncbi:MAG TPA: hypothetical protein VHT24_07415 [Pseudacidobacterium sp.]|nr:hypothetical protein [Pseudacidobacterium sp.]